MTRVRAARGLVCTSTSIKGDQATPVLGSKLRGNPDLTSEGGRGHPTGRTLHSLHSKRVTREGERERPKRIVEGGREGRREAEAGGGENAFNEGGRRR